MLVKCVILVPKDSVYINWCLNQHGCHEEAITGVLKERLLRNMEDKGEVTESHLFSASCSVEQLEATLEKEIAA